MWKWRLLLYAIKLVSASPAKYEYRVRRLLEMLQEEANLVQSHWVTNWIYPKQPMHRGDLEVSNARVGIVMQGPVLTQDSFTLETVRHYRAVLPNSPLVISTWQGQDEQLLRSLESEGAIVLLHPRPSEPGHNNINLQILSTRLGMEAAADLGVEYLVKTRCDARIYSPRFVDFALNLLRTFPVAEGVAMHSRIAILDLATRTYVPNHPSDILMVGHRDDLLAYWNAPFSSIQGPLHAHRPGTRHGELWSQHIPEVYLCENFYERIGYPSLRSLEHWWQALADLFIVIDRTSIEHFWPKHAYAMEHRVHADANMRTLALSSFSEWLSLYHGQRPACRDEEFVRSLRLDAPLAA
jgi:hypothetical protein